MSAYLILPAATTRDTTWYECLLDLTRCYD